MATVGDIPTDLALEIGDDLEPARFIAAVRAFFDLANELAQFPSQDGVANWRVKVSEGSNIVALYPSPTISENVHSAAIQRIHEGTEAIVSGELYTPVLSDKAVDCARRLSDLTTSGDRKIPMRIWVSRQPIEYGPQVAENVKEEKASAYDDFGTIEGTLRVIADRSGALEIKIYDPLWDRPIPCRTSEDQIENAIRGFRKRVEVSGMIHYNNKGRPTSIRVDTMTILPDDEELPKIGEVVGILS